MVTAVLDQIGVPLEVRGLQPVRLEDVGSAPELGSLRAALGHQVGAAEAVHATLHRPAGALSVQAWSGSHRCGVPFAVRGPHAALAAVLPDQAMVVSPVIDLSALEEAALGECGEPLPPITIPGPAIGILRRLSRAGLATDAAIDAEVATGVMGQAHERAVAALVEELVSEGWLERRGSSVAVGRLEAHWHLVAGESLVLRFVPVVPPPVELPPIDLLLLGPARRRLPVGPIGGGEVVIASDAPEVPVRLFFEAVAAYAAAADADDDTDVDQPAT